MSWWYLPWSESIKKRACRYLLQRYLGDFLEHKLTLDQLSVDLFNGTGTVSDVSLDCEALNELGDTQNWPLEIVDGYMSEISVTIPWASLLKDDAVVEVKGLLLTVQSKVRPEPVSSMLESMWSTMSSSMQLAEDCLKQEKENDPEPPDCQPMEGIEMFAHAIDSILSRVKIRFIDTTIRIEHVPKNGYKGIALEIHIKNIDYFDEAGNEPPPETTDPDKSKSYIVSTYTNKKIMIDGITLYTDEFPAKMRTMARSLIMEKSSTSVIEKTLENSHIDDTNFQSTTDVFYETRSVISSSDSEAVKNDSLEQNEAFKKEPSPDEKDTDPILFAKLTGRQEISLKLKHSEEAIGPKVDLNMTFGSLIVFMSPRQLHTITELIDGLNQPQMEDRRNVFDPYSNIPVRQSGASMRCRPMNPADFQLVEQQLITDFSGEPSKASFRGQGWTGQSFDESEGETDIFQPMSSGGGNQMTDSVSTMASSMSASATSSVNIPQMNPRIKRNKKVPHIDGDPTAEVSHISIKLSSCSCVLLHKDILVPVPLGIDCVTQTSAKKMQATAEAFFEKIGIVSVSGEGKMDFDDANKILDGAVSLNHLRLIASSLTLDGSDETTSYGSQTNCEATITSLLLRECLYNSGSSEEGPQTEFIDVIKFHSKEQNEDDSVSVSESASTSVLQPCIRVLFKRTHKSMRVGGERKLLYPTTDVTIKCLPLQLDVDLTLLDRICATVYPPPSPPAAAYGPVSQNQINIAINVSLMDAILRFPIADLTGNANREQRRVRADYIMFNFAEVLISSQQLPSTQPLPTNVTIKATSVDMHYYENESMPGIHIGRSTMYEAPDPNALGGSTVTLPTISITIKPKESPKGAFDPLSDEDDQIFEQPPMGDPMTTSIYVMESLSEKETPSPFSGKKTVHQSKANHQEDHNEKSHIEEVLPGTHEEMQDFTNHCVEKSSIHLDLNFPVLSLQLESKQLYEIIYNRINSDLLLWEPLTTPQYDISPHVVNPTVAYEPSIYPPFSACRKSGFDSDSSSSTEDGNIFYSTYDSKQKSRKLGDVKTKQKTVDKKETHNFCFTLKVAKGLLTMFTPVRDNSKRVVPGQMGELVFDVSKLSMCQVSGLNGKPKTAQLCLRARKATLYHDAIQTIPTDKPLLRIYGMPLPSNLKMTIYPSGRGVMVKEDTGTRDILTLALNVEPQMDLPSFKKICISLGIEGGTLRHRGNVGVAWLNQMLDVLDVLDYPVPGYRPSSVLTELHAHLQNCAIDYRPLYLPIRSVLTLGNFSVSSNIIAQTNTTSLRFLAQDCALFLNQVICKPNESIPLDEHEQPDVLRDYICVCDVGLFEISLRFADKETTRGPHFDMSFSNNTVNLYTCWDSATALCRLVTYIALDSDCTPPEEKTSRQESFCSDQEGADTLLGLYDKQEEIRELSLSQQQEVNDLMEEAILETDDKIDREEDTVPNQEKNGVELFYFPDESNVKRWNIEGDTKNKNDVPDRNIVMDLGDPMTSSKNEQSSRTPKKSSCSGSGTDDDYCFVDPEVPSGGNELFEPKGSWFSDNLLMDSEGYPDIKTKQDILKAPKKFPVPVVRCTLCEMSISWHIYGGNDFHVPKDTPSSGKKRVTISDDHYGSPTANIEYEPYDPSRISVSYSGNRRRRTSSNDSVRSDKYERDSWKKRGGKNRDRKDGVQFNLHKIRFINETYAPDAKQASRQTLVVHRIEVLDRLDRSHINKLLSLYVTDELPERVNAPMVLIKAYHLRPDPTQSTQECCLKVSLLPLRFNIDQDTLAFLTGFFTKLGSEDMPVDGSGNDSDSPLLESASSSGKSTPTHKLPVMSVNRTPSLSESLDEAMTETDHFMEPCEAERLISENLIQLEEEFHLHSERRSSTVTSTPSMDSNSDTPIFFRRVMFYPSVPIRLDYVGKRVDLSAGPMAGLLLGLAQLNCSLLTLKALDHRKGQLGFDRLVKWVLHEWLTDIKRSQLPGLLSGIGPMNSFLQFVRGVRDLIWLPVEQWRRDGRIVHGLRRGAASFTARTAIAALDITAKALHLLQAAAGTAFDVLTPGPTLQLAETYERRERRRRRRRDPARRPADMREGVASAYTTMREGFAETAETIAIAARDARAAGVLRHLPGAAVAPLALAAAGAQDLLGGVRASLQPAAARDHQDKWRPRPEEGPPSE